MIQVSINGETRSIPEDLSLEALVRELGLPADRVAVEHNLQVVRRSDWRAIRVDAGDRIEIVHFVGGG